MSLVSVRLSLCRRACVFFFLSILHRSCAPPTPEEGGGAASRLRAAALLVELDLVLEAVVQLEVVVLQRGGGARREAAVGAGAVEEQAGANGAQQDAQRAHHDDGEEDGVQRVQPGVVLDLLRHQGDGGGVGLGGGRRGEGRGPPGEDVAWEQRKQVIKGREGVGRSSINRSTFIYSVLNHSQSLFERLLHKPRENQRIPPEQEAKRRPGKTAVL